MTEAIRPIIRGEKVYLRPPERTDVPLFVAWFNDANVLRHLDMRAPMSVAMEEGWFDRMLSTEGKVNYHFVICLIADGRPIGTVGLHDIQERTGKAEFGIAIGETDQWGRGYGGDALNAICDFGFGELRLERVELPCLRRERARPSDLPQGRVRARGDAASSAFRPRQAPGRRRHEPAARRVAGPAAEAELGVRALASRLRGVRFGPCSSCAATPSPAGGRRS